MRWPVLVIVAVIAVALETSRLTVLLRLPALGNIYPSLVGVLVVYVALFAPRMAALWAAWSLGLLLDLALAHSEHRLFVGPHALGYTLAAFMVLQLRTMVFRRRILTLALLTGLGLGASAVVEVTVHTLRSWFAVPGTEDAGFAPLAELLTRFGIAIYSCLLAVALGWLLLRSIPLWGFQTAADRGRGWR